MLRFVAVTVALAPFPALGRDNGQWEQQPADLMQPDNPLVSCCGEARAFKAVAFEVEDDHYVAIITDGKGVIAAGTKTLVSEP